MKLSACIVTYNNEATIEKAIASVLAYGKPANLHLYVVDNGSTDRTLEIIRRFPEVTLKQAGKNLGFGAAHNAVRSELDSEIHFVINPDIEVDQPVFTHLSEEMRAHPQIVQLTCAIRNPDGSPQILFKKDPTFRYLFISKLPGFHYLRTKYTRADEVFSGPTEIDVSTGCFFAVRTKIFQQVGGFDPRYFMYLEDADLSRRLRTQGSIVFDPQVSVIHGWKRDNLRSWSGIRRWFQSYLKYISRWGWSF